MAQLLAAIVADRRSRVETLLRADPLVATQLIGKAKLYRAGLLHWIYVGDSALHLAAAGHRVEITQLLLAAGADPNAASNHRRGRPIHYAADGVIGESWYDPKRQVRTLRCLLDAGADVEAQDKNGATALHRATRGRSASAVTFLLSAGADPTRINVSGSTPFHLAVQNTGRGGTGSEPAKEAQREIIAAFLSLGVSVALKDGQGKTVVDRAGRGWVGEMLANVRR